MKAVSSNGDSSGEWRPSEAERASRAGAERTTRASVVKRRRAGDRRVNINDVANHAGVSVATVSRALRGLENVSADTRQRVEQAAADLEYHIDRRASRLATGRHESVALVVPRIDTWYFSSVLAGIESVLGQLDDLLLVCVDDIGARAQLVAGSAPLRKRVDGLIFIDVVLEPDEADELDRVGLRVVTVGQRIRGFSSVTIDNRGAARTVTDHLFDAGHRRIGLICTSGSGLAHTVPVERRNGFQDSCVAHDAAPRPEHVVDTDVDVAAGAGAMSRLLDGPQPPTAVFAMTDELAVGALGEARRRGLRVPEDMAIAGFDDHPVAGAVDLTTIRQEPHAQGAAAAELFVGLGGGNGGPGPSHHVADTELIVRGSSCPVASGAEKSPRNP